MIILSAETAFSSEPGGTLQHKLHAAGPAELAAHGGPAHMTGATNATTSETEESRHGRRLLALGDADSCTGRATPSDACTRGPSGQAAVRDSADRRMRGRQGAHEGKNWAGSVIGGPSNGSLFCCRAGRGDEPAGTSRRCSNATGPLGKRLACARLAAKLARPVPLAQSFCPSSPPPPAGTPRRPLFSAWTRRPHHNRPTTGSTS